MEDELTDDALAGPIRIWQRKRGHRYSIDDILTSMLAVQAMPEARTCLDLGCGIGSVLLSVAYKLPLARLVGVEAQRVSYNLALRNVERNDLGHRVEVQRGDLRDEALVTRLQQARPDGFDLVSGTPPYQPPGAGIVSPDSQRAHARVELRGGVEDYLATAGRLVADQGAVVVCADARTPERVLSGAREAGLHAHVRTDVIPIQPKRPLFSVWRLSRREGSLVVTDPFVSRDPDGSRSAASQRLRIFFDSM